MKDKSNYISGPIHGVKALGPTLKCRDFQYEIGGTYKHEGEVVPCQGGFHFCLNPLDVLTYYPPNSRFAKVVGNNGFTHQEDSKVATGEINIASEISLKDLVRESVKWISLNSSGEASTTGDAANAATTGARANAATTGSAANAATTGDAANAVTTGSAANAATTGARANAATTGENSVAAALGINSSASGAIGNWLMLVEWSQIGIIWTPVDAKAVKVDGIIIKPFVKYSLKSGQFVEAE